jgi:hypothetical protein
MEGIKQAIDKYKGRVYDLSVDKLQREFGQESFNTEWLNQIATPLCCTRVAGQSVHLNQVVHGAAGKYDRLNKLKLSPEKSDYLRMLVITLYSDPRTFELTIYGIPFELERLLPYQTRVKYIQKVIDKYGDKINRMSVKDLGEEFGQAAFKADLLESAADKLGASRYDNNSAGLNQILWPAAENYHQLTTYYILTEEEADHVQLITRAIYSDQRTYITHINGISFELEKLLPESIRRGQLDSAISHYGPEIYQKTVTELEDEFTRCAFKADIWKKASELLKRVPEMDNESELVSTIINCSGINQEDASIFNQAPMEEERGKFQITSVHHQAPVLLGPIVRIVAERYHQLADYSLNPEEIDHLQWVTRVFYSNPQTFVEHKISPMLKELLV